MMYTITYSPEAKEGLALRGYGALFNKRFGIVFTNALARMGLLRFCDRLAVNERVLEGLQIVGNECVVGFSGLELPQKGLKMGVLRG